MASLFPPPHRPHAVLAIFWITALAFPLWWLLPDGDFLDRLVLLQPLGQGQVLVAEFGGWQSRLALSGWALERGWWSTLLTHLLVHGGYPDPLPAAIFVGLLHLGANMVTLVSLGRRVERDLGSARLLGLYLLSGVCGGLLQVLGNPAGADLPLVGASGGVFGVVMAYCLLHARQRLLLFFVVKAKAGTVGWVLLSLTLGLAALGLALRLPGLAETLRVDRWNEGLQLLVLRIGHLAHLGGALVGLAWGLASRGPQPRGQQPPSLPSSLLHTRAEPLPGPAEELVEAVARSRALGPSQRQQLSDLRAAALEELGRR